MTMQLMPLVIFWANRDRIHSLRLHPHAQTNEEAAKGKLAASSAGPLAVTLAILISAAPYQASAKGGMKMCCLIPRAEAATITSKPVEPHAPTITIGGCGGKRYRDPITQHCRGPADFGH